MSKLPTRHAFSWYLVILIGLGTSILLATYFRLRPYLTSIGIFSINTMSTDPLVSGNIKPTVSLITNTSAQISFSPLPAPGTIFAYGLSSITFSAQLPLTNSPTITLSHLLPRRRYFFRIGNSPTYSFVTKAR